MKRIVWLCALPLSVLAGQGHPISPYARAGIGTGTLGFDDASVKTLEGGVTLWSRLSVGVEYMDLAGSSEFGRWTVGIVQLHVLPVSRKVSPWLAAGIGSATARMPDNENSPSYKQSYRFSGGGLASAIGVDIGLVPHLFMTPSLSVKKSMGDAEMQACRTNLPNGPTNCDPWAPASHPFQTFELRIAVGTRY